MIGNYEVWWTVAMVKVEDQGLTERSWRVPWPSRAKGGQAMLVPRSRSGSQQPPPTLHYPINTAAGVCIRDCRGIHWYYQDIMCHQPGPGQCVWMLQRVSGSKQCIFSFTFIITKIVHVQKCLWIYFSSNVHTILFSFLFYLIHRMRCGSGGNLF